MKLRNLSPFCLWLLAATASADTVVYDLDSNNAKEITEAIQSVLAAQCTAGPTSVPVTNQTMCRAELLPTGQLIVEGPSASQTQIAAVLKTIAARAASPTPRVTLQYWVIYGEPGKPDAADSALKPLSAVLQQIERAHGELGFAVQDTASITAQSGTNAKAVGGALQIGERVRANGDGIDLSAQISFTRQPVNQNLDVTVTIKRGEYVVLGERTAAVTAADKPGMLFYVVHWPQGQ